MTKNIIVDSTDKSILYFLLQDAWLKDSQIAKKIGVSKQVVNYRIKKLTESGYILHYRTSTNSSVLGKTRYSILFSLNEGIKINEVKNFLISIPEISALIECVGKWDFYISLWVDDPSNIDKTLKLISDKIKKYSVIQTVYSATMFGRILNNSNQWNDRIDKKGKKGSKITSLTETDKKIISALNQSKKESLISISRKIGIPYQTLKYNIKKLQDIGYLQRFFAVLDMNKLGYQEWTCLCKISHTKIDEIEKFVEYMDKRKEFSFYMRCIGEWNFYLSIFVKSPAEFKEIFHEVYSKFNELIEEYETFVIQQIH